MSKLLVVASVVWPLLLAATVWQRQDGHRPMWTTAVYAAASRICHQRPERSFHTGDAQWPVCARCSGLYLSAPAGALAAVVLRRRRDPAWSPILIVALAALPTALTLGLEWSALAAVSNRARALAALPLGAAVAFVLAETAAGPPKTDRVH
jgi:uncharacterized membrane protein